MVNFFFKIFLGFFVFYLFHCQPKHSEPPAKVQGQLSEAEVVVVPGVETNFTVDVGGIEPSGAQSVLDSYDYHFEPELPKGIILKAESDKLVLAISNSAVKKGDATISNIYRDYKITLSIDGKNYKGSVGGKFTIIKPQLQGFITYNPSSLKVRKGEYIDSEIVLGNIRKGSKESKDYFYEIKKENSDTFSSSVGITPGGRVTVNRLAKDSDSGVYEITVIAKPSNTHRGKISVKMKIEIL